MTKRFTIAVIVTIGLLGGTLTAGPASAGSTVRVAPKTIDFGTKAVGDTYYDSVKITNSSGVPLNVIVEGGLPDDFGFGLLPGSTCPVLTPGAVMAPRESCVAVVRFTPSEYFVGWHQTGALTVTTTDPATGSRSTTSIPVSGLAKL